ncbi:hypothetical protein NDU88_003316 [Pleurodeles waltl]|uniref:Uncharacterized protein n=1 Tax=Pleurodeles waltl TaxID=8319 RepID=A0AAV7T4Z0_PLEWA|nr:hypothetical protein NDU88_003316 [Pleurodeles waltl]
MDRWHLQRENFRDMCDQKSEQYLPENHDSVASGELVWEAQKAYLRSEIISYAKGQKEKGRQKIWDLEGRILDLENHFVSQEQEAHLQDLIYTQNLLRRELTQETRAAWRVTRSRVYQWGDKAGKTLHWLCTPRMGITTISYLQMREGSKVMGHGLMAQAFANYYQGQCQEDPTSPRLDLLQFVQDLPVPSLSAEDRVSLEMDVSVEQLRTALGQNKCREGFRPKWLPIRVLPPGVAACRSAYAGNVPGGLGK